MAASDWVSLTMGLGGLIIGAFGMWLTYTSRTAAFQQTLHTKQVEVGLAIEFAISTYVNAVLSAASRGDVDAERFAIIEKAAHRVFSLLLRNEVLLPNRLVAAYHDFLGEMSQLTAERFKEAGRLIRPYEKLEREIRAMIGTDQLSARNMLLLRKQSSGSYIGTRVQ